ncbi:LPS export ABC transporter periplasmic protein LptC [Vulcanococcus sp.]|uniref:LPS export ABC transporter periplasmic protein LptC n=1 Tax=Vulcanococcus sp. TaxID=2856995 RepID=UPI0037DA0205
MTRFTPLRLLSLSALTTGLVGCTTAPKAPPPEEPFVFRALDLRQRDALGAPAWELLSPEARYDIVRQLAQARQPRGTIYKQGRPHITIGARSGTVIGDGQAIQLEGDVEITLLGANPVRITGDQVRWIPSQDLMVIDRRPSAIDRRTRIQAGLARYRIKADQLELRGTPVLEHWQQGAAPSAPLRVQTAWLNWRPEQGDLVAREPVRGVRRDASSQLELRAQGLQGNIRRGFVDLQAPVQVRDPKRQGWLNASTTRWAINDQLLSSDQPVQGGFKALRGQGKRWRVNLANSTVALDDGCRVEQPGERLSASQCLWNWPTGRFQAKGAVELDRSTYSQRTRAGLLLGRIGADGVAVFTAPGSRVNSRFTIPTQQRGPGAARRSDPVQF